MTAPPAGALEACPFCGGEAELRGKTQQRYVACLTNRCVDGPYGDFDDDAAIAAWNRRTHGPALLAALRLREGCEASAKKWEIVRQFASGDDFDRWEDMARGSHIPSDAGNEYADDRADDLARVLEEGE